MPKRSRYAVELMKTAATPILVLSTFALALATAGCEKKGEATNPDDATKADSAGGEEEGGGGGEEAGGGGGEEEGGGGGW